VDPGKPQPNKTHLHNKITATDKYPQQTFQMPSSACPPPVPSLEQVCTAHTHCQTSQKASLGVILVFLVRDNGIDKFRFTSDNSWDKREAHEE
jgi:hypothetical protein